MTEGIMWYPHRDKRLIPLHNRALEWIAPQEYETRLIRRMKTALARIHGSVDGNATFAILTLRLGDPRLDVLIGYLLDYQWPDGDWNCDRKAKGTTSQFDETLIPFRALALHARLTGNGDSWNAARKAAEVF
jgi:hypothetical protein